MELALELARRICTTARLTGSFGLRSGEVSEEYFDKYLFESDPVLLRTVATGMLPLVPDCDVLASRELGGIPVATVMSQLSRRAMVFVRKSAKEYGTCKLAEGGRSRLAGS